MLSTKNARKSGMILLKRNIISSLEPENFEIKQNKADYLTSISKHKRSFVDSINFDPIANYKDSVQKEALNQNQIRKSFEISFKNKNENQL